MLHGHWRGTDLDENLGPNTLTCVTLGNCSESPFLHVQSGDGDIKHDRIVEGINETTYMTYQA